VSDRAADELHFFGLRRSGNHAVLGWIIACAASNGRRTRHFNDVHDDRMEPPKVPQYGDPLFAPTRWVGLTIYSYQDIGYTQIPGVPHYAARPKSSTTRYILRDLPNLIASRIKMYEGLEERGLRRSVMTISYEELACMWVEYARDYVREPDPASGTINYALWFQSRCYRDEVFAALGLGPNSDQGLNEVSGYGFGSSFDLRAYDGRGQDMGVLKRWRHFRQDNRYRQALASHPEARELNRAVAEITAAYLGDCNCGRCPPSRSDEAHGWS
jgi:hypothetical protein